MSNLEFTFFFRGLTGSFISEGFKEFSWEELDRETRSSGLRAMMEPIESVMKNEYLEDIRMGQR